MCLSGSIPNRSPSVASLSTWSAPLRAWNGPGLWADCPIVRASAGARVSLIRLLLPDPLTPVITTSLFERFSSRGQNAFAAKVNAALRNQFGGHAVQAAGPTSGAGSTQG